MEANAIGVSVGVEVIRRTVPSGLKWLSAYARGVEMLIVGPGDVGKTSISDYLQFGMLETYQQHEKTLEIQNSKTFQISIGRDEALKLRVRRTIDVPGQTGPVEHANLVRERRPHCVLIVLDSSKPIDTVSRWLSPFCERLDHIYREDSRLLKKNRGLFVALNKRDAVRRTTDFDARQRHVKKCLVNGLGDVIGKQSAKAIPVMPTIAVQSRDGSELLDSLIRKVAKQVSR
ncbi:GTPase domain-containing protein [Novipirellula caenicola]|uniref:G domain-containing protein n=1 Tax=Novipirellula caenicola TaxID=1536901 RepID=A0ABP9VY10_9BACT